ncbi:MAG: peptidylprolyl isomerase [Myxococcota bacterium]
MAWWRDPLVHFLGFGLIVTAVETLRGAPPGATLEPERVVMVDTAAIRADFEAVAGRPPSDAEARDAIDDWVRIEVLVREARALGLDRDDAVVRARLAQKMVYVVNAVQAPPEPDEATLRARWAVERETFVRPETLTLRQLFAPDRAVAEALAAHWRAGEDPRALAATLLDAPGGPVLRRRTPERLAEVYGPGFSDQVAALEIGRPAVVRSDLGWHVVAVLERAGGRTPTYEQARGRLVQAAKAAWLTEATEAAVTERLDDYTIVEQ